MKAGVRRLAPVSGVTPSARLGPELSLTCGAGVGDESHRLPGGAWQLASDAGLRRYHGEHPGARVSVAETLIGGAGQQPRFAESDIRHSQGMTPISPGYRLA